MARERNETEPLHPNGGTFWGSVNPEPKQPGVGVALVKAKWLVNKAFRIPHTESAVCRLRQASIIKA